MTKGANMIAAKGNPNLRLALAKARDQKLLEQAATVRMLQRAGSSVSHLRPGTLALFGPLMTGRA